MAACVAGVALIAGCGTEHVPAGGAPTPTHTAPDLTAAVSRTQTQTARIAVSITSGSPGMSMTFTESGLFDFAHSRGMISMQGPVGLTEIFLPPTVYIKGPTDGGASALPKGKTWVAMPDTLVSGSPAAGGLLGPLGGSGSPAGLLASLTAASSNVTRLGPSTVRGVAVTGFALKIDPAKEAARMPAADRAISEAFLKSLGLTEIPVDVWVDGQNLVRREKVTLALPSGSGAPAGTSIVMTTDFYDFGVPVHVSAPPASEVAKEPDLPISSSGSASGSVPIMSASGSAGAVAAPTPPAASGTLTAAQATAAEQAVTAFWTALGANNSAAVARTVLPSQQSCVQSSLGAGEPTIKVSALHITSARPAGNAAATMFFTVKANASLGGMNIPVFPQGSGNAQWLATTEVAGRWYVNITGSTAVVFGGTGACG